MPIDPALLSWNIDVSNFQPKDLTPLIRLHQPDHVIVRANMPWENIPQDITPFQVASVLINGCTLGMYEWFYRSVDPIRMVNALLDLCASINVVLPILWLDIEYSEYDPGPTVDQVRQALAHCHELEVPVGLYTGAWHIQDHLPGGWDAWRKFKDVPHWVSDYDGIADLEILDPRWRGFKVVGKQWSGDPDRNVMFKQYTELAVPPAPVDPCEQLRQELSREYHRKPYKAITKTRLRQLGVR